MPLLLPVLLCTDAAAQDNVMLIVLDDVGVDMIGCYGEHPSPASTPVFDGLAKNGILFRNAWSHVACSPTRASLLTGRQPFQTGIGRAQDEFDDIEVALAERTLPELLPPDYHSAAIGKWHMHSHRISGLMHPLLQGFDSHRGAIANLPEYSPHSYFNFWKSIDGVSELCTTYATTDSVDETLSFIGEFPEPWFLWVAFNAAHTPWHDPPHDLHSQVVPHTPSMDPVAAVKAAVEAMDTEVGRLLKAVDPGVLSHTTVIVIGDNGTHMAATTPPFDPAHGKETIYEGGINVPLIISGPGVATGAVCDGLVQATDVFATILDIAGVAPPPGTTGTSLVPYFAAPDLPSLRPWVFSERFRPNGFGPYAQHQRAIRDQRYKLIRDLDAGGAVLGEQLYDLQDDPYEATDLLPAGLDLSQQASYDMMATVLDGIEPPWQSLGCALAGAATPTLEYQGTLLPGDDISISLKKGPKLTTVWLLVSPTQVSLPFKGGTLVPGPDNGLFLPLQTDDNGKLTLSAPCPAGFPSNFKLYMQFWIPTPSGPAGFVASDALQLTMP